VPNRDLGIQASGELFNGALGYQAGLFNGLGDGRSSNNTDFDNGKDVAGRVMATPFRQAAESPLQGLSFGIAGSSGRTKTAAGRTAGYRTDGQQVFFSYDGGVIADGKTWRVAPQFDYRLGSFGALGEYVVSAVNVRPGAAGARAELQNRAWQIAAGYVVTGEASSYGGVTPRTNFDLAAGTWGALELVARYSNLNVDAATFPLFASAGNNAREASALGLGFNWFLSKAVVFKVDYYRTEFDFHGSAAGAPASGVTGQDEQVVISRFQFGF
jgi:phosphate-selective porin OprO/OprP